LRRRGGCIHRINKVTPAIVIVVLYWLLLERREGFTPLRSSLGP
jgi:hypothetical protein